MIAGIVVEGQKKGRRLGFPTANIKVAGGVAVEPGIYAGRISIKGKPYNAALYLTGNDIIEAYLFDFDGDLYGRELSVDMVKKIRDRQDFKNDDEAMLQIANDIREIKTCLQEL